MSLPRVSAAILLEINRRVTGNINVVVVKPNELQSAVQRPEFTAYYEQAGPVKQAASLAYGVIMGHPFLDGNKRTAFWAANEYLKNSGTPTFTDAEPNAVNSTQAMQGIGEAHSRVAQSQMTVDELANIYSQALGL